MKFKIGIKEVVAMGIGTALFVVLTNAQIPLIVVPNTALQPRMAILAFLSAVFGPIVGAVVGLLGHALGDALFYGSVWWSWVIPEGVVGLCIGLFVNKFAVKEGGFVNGKNIILFNVVQIVANAIAWILCAPVLDILMFAEPANKVFAQGAFAFLGNIIVIGILGTILLIAYSKIVGGSNNLQKED
ncbi:MAG: ECF-type riboflavin transporter substrate-binding protein [Butyrivibrio sp.]|uniref:ECF-type riboflavin transporter substrate-binding protein n=1 Tax=Butyrivibrio sp. TaxID=28121 RepID=UPI001B54E18C|nr:ECF-type riboflavin transporter substrate-binding protein [Butyrivibrio sp.]MBP3278920.1 ECF-type riboflavin transporter substrate-binding protein [Butyrivibrio sp.]MBP3781613.1 ECF-type riboflavin transporter substrate-binding protein [Butyrivibrio sp.]MBP3813226.1 ECF-type riboflavin transporter substrate-binding protein [Butyrivibrio sp.]